MSAPPLYTGSCKCGALQIALTSEPFIKSLCHCHDCRKTTGSAFSTNAVFPLPSFTLTRGTPTLYTKQGSSGHPVHVHFCSVCSTAMWTQGEAMPEIVIIKVGCLDGDALERLTPGMEVFTKRRVGWVCEVEGAVQMGEGYVAAK